MKDNIYATTEMMKAGGDLLWEKQWEGSPWQGKIALIDPKSMQQYYDLAAKVYFAMAALDKDRKSKQQ